MNIKWNADDYTEDFKFVHKYGEDVLALAEIRPGMRVLDLGCGNGALSRKIKDMGADVTGIDGSAEMLDIARDSYPDIPFIQADAISFSMDEPVDVVFANAVFHWIDKDKQQTLIQHVAKALKPGGVLVFEMGGKHCNRLIHGMLHSLFEKRGLAYMMPFYFPSIGEYTPLLEANGFLTASAFLFDRPTVLTGENGMQDWIRMFLKMPFTGLEENLAAEIIEEAAQKLKPALYKDGIWYADYVRLRARAVKI